MNAPKTDDVWADEGGRQPRRLYWLIERMVDGQPQWWSGQHSGAFTTIAEHAIQFARREDARSIMRTSVYDGGMTDLTITEHADA